MASINCCLTISLEVIFFLLEFLKEFSVIVIFFPSFEFQDVHTREAAEETLRDTQECHKRTPDTCLAFSLFFHHSKIRLVVRKGSGLYRETAHVLKDECGKHYNGFV